MEDQIINLLNLYSDPNWNTFKEAVPLILGASAFVWNNAVGIWKNLTWSMRFVRRTCRWVWNSIYKLFEVSELEKVIVSAMRGVRLYDYHLDKLTFPDSGLEVTLDDDSLYMISPFKVEYKGESLVGHMTRRERKRIRKLAYRIRNIDRAIMDAEKREDDKKKALASRIYLASSIRSTLRG